MAEAPRGSSVGSLIGVILLIFVFYIIFLPEAERQELLEGTPSPVTPGATPAQGVLFEASALRLAVPEVDELRRFPNTVLEETRVPEVVLQAPPFEVWKGWFSDRVKDFTFFISSPERVEEAHLTFQAPVKRGILRVSINGYVVYESRVTTPPLIPVPRQLLQRENVVSFDVDGGFFEKKEYKISDLKVLLQKFDPKRAMTEYTFTISEDEFADIETARLEFFAQCAQANAGVLTVSLNEVVIAQSVPACDSPNRFDIDRSSLVPGRNSLRFMLEKGRMGIEQVRLVLGEAESKPLIGYFSIDERTMADLLDRVKRVVIDVDFVGERYKQAVLNVNGVKYAIDQSSKDYSVDVTPDIRFGNNYVSLTPLTDLDISEFQVVLEEA